MHFRSKCNFYVKYASKKNVIFGTYLTAVKRSRERSINFPIVIVNFLCDRTIRSSKMRQCAGFESYHFAAYAASPIVLPYNRAN